MARWRQWLRYGERYVTAWMGLRAPPSFLIIGAQKAGTTSLFQYLAQHPQIVSPLTKEVCYFSHPHRYRRGRSFYLAYFPRHRQLRSGDLTFEASPRYLYHRDSAARIHEFNAQMKLIVLAREPVARAYSHWNSFRDIWKKNPNFKNAKVDPDEWRMLEALLRPNGEMASFESLVHQELELVDRDNAPSEPSLVRRGLYYRQLLPFLECFPRAQLLVVGTEELNREPVLHLNQICRFLGIDEFAPGMPRLEKHNERPYQHHIESDVHQSLRSFYRPHNRALFEWMGRDLGWDQDSGPGDSPVQVGS